MLRLVFAALGTVTGSIVLLPFVLLAAPLFLVSAATRLVRRRLEPKAAPWQEIVDFDSQLGWKPKPHLNTLCSFPAGVFRTKTGADGWPGQITFEDCAVVAIGDSYVFGYGVDSNRAFYSLSRSVKIKPIGSPGYSMVHAVLWLRRLAPQLKGKLVVWFPCYSNDLYDNLLPNLYHYRTPFARQSAGGNWEIYDRHVSQEPWPFNYGKNARVDEKFHAVFGENPLSSRVYAASRFLIQTARDVCADAGASLAIISVPWPVQIDSSEWTRWCARSGEPSEFQKNAPDEKLAAICRDLDVPFLEGRNWLRAKHHIPGEGHWNEKGHQTIAGLVERIHRKWMDDRQAAPGEPESDPAMIGLRFAAGRFG